MILFQESPEPAEEEPLLKEESVELQGEAREDEGDRERLSLLEDQLKQLLEALISVADMVSATRRAAPNTPVKLNI